MQLFIIGNGFDKGHGLATSYWDFRTYLENMYPEFLYSFEEHYDIYPQADKKAKKEMLWNQLETNLANINEDAIIDQAVSIEMGLESGDVGIEDTLYDYLSDQYRYIALLTRYIKQWVRTIRIRDVCPKTSVINNENDALYITFNYTAVLETVYKVDREKIIHIHGSLRQCDDPILGHGNIKRMEEIQKRRHKAENIFSEKETAICKVIEDYYSDTYKNISRYMPKLSLLAKKDIGEIFVIGHSLTGVDIPYFKNIDELTKRMAKWKLYYHCCKDKKRMVDDLIECGVNVERIKMLPSNKFYDMK